MVQTSSIKILIGAAKQQIKYETAEILFTFHYSHKGAERGLEEPAVRYCLLSITLAARDMKPTLHLQEVVAGPSAQVFDCTNKILTF